MKLMGMRIYSLPYELNKGGCSGRSASVDESVQSQSLRRNAQKIKPSSISPNSHLTYQRRTSKAIKLRQCSQKGSSNWNGHRFRNVCGI